MMSASFHASRAAQSAYGTSNREIASDRTIEADLFRRSIARLNPYKGEAFSLNAESVVPLSDNLKLWDMLCADLIHPDNSLPDTLRDQLLSLGAFVRHHTFGLFSGRETRLDVLVDINMTILDGLEGRSAPAEAA